MEELLGRKRLSIGARANGVVGTIRHWKDRDRYREWDEYVLDSNVSSRVCKDQEPWAFDLY